MTPRRPSTGQQVLSVLLGLGIAVGIVVLAVQWLLCGQEAGTALCMAATAAMPRWWHLRNRCITVCRRLRRRWLNRRLAQAQHQVLHWKTLQLEDAFALIEAEDRVAQIQRDLHHLGHAS